MAFDHSTSHRRTVFRASSWRGLSQTENWFIFGDSYSSVNEDDDFLPKPTATHPLGTPEPFPGDPWTGDGPNWVGHLLLLLQPDAYAYQTTSTPGSPPPANARATPIRTRPLPPGSLRIYDYAKGGDTVLGLASQVRQKFLARHAKSVSWTAENSLFVLFIGINDLAETAFPARPMKQLFQLVNELYDAGARNFLFIDCPPIHRTPSADPDFGPDSTRYEDWNKMLFTHAKAFVTQHQDYTTARPSTSSDRTSFSASSSHPMPFSPVELPKGSSPAFSHRHTTSSASSNYSAQSTPGSTPSTPGLTPLSTPDGNGVLGDTSVFIFSAWNSLLSVLDYPEAYDFDSEDVDQAEGPIWMDNLHPTSKVHAVLAKHLYAFLADIK